MKPLRSVLAERKKEASRISPYREKEEKPLELVLAESKKKASRISPCREQEESLSINPCRE